MKGKLIKDHEGWWVQHKAKGLDGNLEYIAESMLHPDDVKFLEDCRLWFDNIEGRVVANPEVEFEMVTEVVASVGNSEEQDEYTIRYAKLIPSKEQQKQLITEIMDLDAKDGLYEDEVDKLAHQYNPVMKLDAEFIRAGFKAGYKKAKETLPKKETQYLDEMPNVDKKLLAKMWEDTIPRVDPKRRVFLMNAHGVIDTRESKQETTIEEAAENYGWRIKTNTFSDPVKANELAQSAKQDFMEGAKWYREQLKQRQ